MVVVDQSSGAKHAMIWALTHTSPTEVTSSRCSTSCRTTAPPAARRPSRSPTPSTPSARPLQCEPGEALAVNLAFALSHVPDESVSLVNPLDELLHRVRALGPHIVTVVEQELNSNTAPLATCFSDACLHYGAILDSLDSTVSRESRRGQRRRWQTCRLTRWAGRVQPGGAVRGLRQMARTVRHGRVPAGGARRGHCRPGHGARRRSPARPARQAGKWRAPARVEWAGGDRRLRLALI